MADDDSYDADLRDFFAIIYDGDDWTLEPDTEESAGELAASDEGSGVNDPTLGVEAQGSNGLEREGTVDKVEEAVTVSPTQSTRERYTRKRFHDQLDSLFNPSPKRSRLTSRAPRPSAPSSYASFTPLPPLPPLSTYAPFSPLSLLARLRTFDAFAYSSCIPSPLTPLDVALAGWTAGRTNSGLQCGLCGAGWHLGDVVDIPEEEIRREVARRMDQAGMKTSQHRRGCAWKITPSPKELYGQLRRMLHPPTTQSVGPLKVALEREVEDLGKVRWASPLPGDIVHHLATTLSKSASPTPSSTSPVDQSTSSTTAPSRAASALAFFAWYPYHPNADSTHVQVHNLLPAPSAEVDEASPPADTFSTLQTSIVQCRLCERRVGLWSFLEDKEVLDRSTLTSPSTSERAFDLVEEHLDWCPIKGDRTNAARTEADVLGSGGKETGPDASEALSWWSDLPILGGNSSRKTGAAEGWVTISDKLVRKPWHRR